MSYNSSNFSSLNFSSDSYPWPKSFSKQAEPPLCDHKEADTRLIVHIVDTLKFEEQSTCLVHTVDTRCHNSVGKFFYLNSAAGIWLTFGVGINFVYLHINTICHNLREEKC